MNDRIAKTKKIKMTALAFIMLSSFSTPSIAELERTRGGRQDPPEGIQSVSSNVTTDQNESGFLCTYLNICWF